MTGDVGRRVGEDETWEPVVAGSSRRRLLRWVGRGGALLALSGSGVVVLRRAGASDDDDEDDNSGSGSGGDDDNSGSGSDNSGSGGDEDHSGHGGGGDDDGGDDDRDDEDDDGEVVATDAVPAGSIEIRIISDDAGGFSPGELTVDAGASVTFVNGHDDPHTATGAGFDTGIMQPSAIATIVLDEPDTYFYACQIHPEMTGSIIVLGAEASPEASPAASTAASPEASPVTGEGGGEATVTISGFAYDPAELTVAVGTTVTWENADPAPHTASAEDGSFGSGQIDPGGSASVTLDQAGTFPYRCAFHPDMAGTVTVE